MTKKYDVTALGETLIDFTYNGKSAAGKNLYEENPGGAPANCAAAVAKLGGKSSFIGMTGDDQFGKDIRTVLSEIGVDISGMCTTDNQHTTLAFVNLSPSGERSFSFCRNPGADTQLSASDLNMDILATSRILQIGSLSLTNEPSKTAELRAIDIVKQSGGCISYDPNWRAPLWKNKDAGLAAMKSLMPFADIVKISDEELGLLYFNGTPGKQLTSEQIESGAQQIINLSSRLVLVTLGAKGVYYRTKMYSGTVGAPEVKVVDTTGAGDSFTGGLLYRLTRREGIFSYTQTELEEDLRFANAVASVCVTRRGAIPALPTLSETEQFLKEHKA